MWVSSGTFVQFRTLLHVGLKVVWPFFKLRRTLQILVTIHDVINKTGVDTGSLD